MHLKTYHVLLFLGVLAIWSLVVIFFLQARWLHEDGQRQSIPSLESLLAGSSDGWAAKDIPIADTPEMQKAVNELLNFDAGVCRAYTKGGAMIVIYAAYWRAGKMPSRMIHTHTPDVCWTGAGWTMTDLNYEYPLQREARSCKPAQWRRFVRDGVTQNVIYWHIAGERAVVYKTNGLPPWWAPLADLWNMGLEQKATQLFVRISSDLPIEEIWNEAPVVETVRALGPLGIFAVGQRGGQVER